MTIYSLEFNAAQLRKVKSSDTISELCMRICAQITGYFRMQLVDNLNQPGADQVETAFTMLQWYFSILNRAGIEDSNYFGSPQIITIYIEKTPLDGHLVAKHAFNFSNMKRIPNHLLMEFMQLTCQEVLKIITPTANINTMSFHQIQKWENKIMNSLTDVSVAMGLEPIVMGTKLLEVMMKFSVPDDHEEVYDFLG